MNVAKWVLLTLLALPFLELAAFVAVGVAIGFLWAVGLLILTSFAGSLLLRHAGGSHIARMRVVMAEGSFSSLQADGRGGLMLLAGILLFIPGFITDFVGLLVLLAAFWPGAALGRAPAARSDGVVDLEPEQWRRVPDPALADQRNNDTER